jgi:hypothetical protein
LCWSCYYTPGVREKYPSTSKHARRYPETFRGKRPLPAEPTQARPGTEAKILVMQARAERGDQLHHPADAKCTVSLAEFALMGRAA